MSICSCYSEQHAKSEAGCHAGRQVAMQEDSAHSMTCKARQCPANQVVFQLDQGDHNCTLQDHNILQTNFEKLLEAVVLATVQPHVLCLCV